MAPELPRSQLHLSLAPDAALPQHMSFLHHSEPQVERSCHLRLKALIGHRSQEDKWSDSETGT